MSTKAKDATASVIPILRYRDAAAAIRWLCEAFGFSERTVVPGEKGAIAHAELVFGNGMVMLGSARAATPRDPASTAGARDSPGPYVVVEDADEHCAHTVAAGAEIVVALHDPDHGGRAYSCRDPEGYVWNFGTYDPWAAAQGGAAPGNPAGGSP